MDAKHTPGPWYARYVETREIGENSHESFHAIEPVKGFETICYVASRDKNVIAAAPEMYEALRRAIQLFESYKLKAESFDCGPWINAAREAIAKAEGRS